MKLHLVDVHRSFVATVPATLPIFAMRREQLVRVESRERLVEYVS